MHAAEIDSTAEFLKNLNISKSKKNSKYFSLFINGPDGFESGKNKGLVTHSL